MDRLQELVRDRPPPSDSQAGFVRSVESPCPSRSAPRRGASSRRKMLQVLRVVVVVGLEVLSDGVEVDVVPALVIFKTQQAPLPDCERSVERSP